MALEQEATDSGAGIPTRSYAREASHNTTNQKPTRRIPSHGNGLVIALVVSARRAVVAAPPGIKVRDALTLCRILARIFALFNAWQFPRRLLDVFFSGAGITFDLGADLHKYASAVRNICKNAKQQAAIIVFIMFC